jgi:hypothetical protein
MRPLNATQLLSLWDAGQACHPIDRALLALGLAMPENTPDELADRPVGWREANLLALRNATFGNSLEGYAPCPACGSLMEFGIDGAALLRQLPVPAADALIEFAGHQWRLPNSRDQALIGDASDADAAVHRLLERCRLAGNSAGGAVTPAGLAELEERMEALDPAANISLAMHCTDCGHAWDAVLDVGSCFWDELGSRARQLLEAVHRLASAYGWGESQILGLSPARRAAYLAMIG